MEMLTSDRKKVSKNTQDIKRSIIFVPTSALCNKKIYKNCVFSTEFVITLNVIRKRIIDLV